MTTAVRRYRDEDREAVAKVWLDSWRSTGLPVANHVTNTGNLDRIDRELAAGWEIHLAWDEDRLVGFLALKPGDACLDQLFISPEAQGSGVGRALLDLAKGQMPAGFLLRTSAHNHPAPRFYEPNGTPRGEKPPPPPLRPPPAIYRSPRMR